MAKLYFRYGVVHSAKTLNLLAVAHNYRQQNKRCIVVKPRMDDRFEVDYVVSQAGLKVKADIILDDNFKLIDRDNIDDHPYAFYSCVLVDEAQFLSPDIIEQFRDVVSYYRIPVICYGLRTDFQRKLFPGSRRLLELADSIEEIKTTCQFCNSKAVFNMRHRNNLAVLEGAQIHLGGQDDYWGVCSECYNTKISEARDALSQG